MCLSLEHQNPSKTSEKMGYFDRVDDRVTVSLHILYNANQETEGLARSAYVELLGISVRSCRQIIDDRCFKPGRGGGTPHMKGVGMLVGNFELNP